MACVIAGLLGAILYNYLSLGATQKQLAQLESDARILQELNEPLEKEIQEVKRKQVVPSQPVEVKPVPEGRYFHLRGIVAKIQQNWGVTDDMRGKECRLTLGLTPSGDVNSIDILSGDELLCKASVIAVQQAAPFDMPSDPEKYRSLKTITVTLSPQFH